MKTLIKIRIGFLLYVMYGFVAMAQPSTLDGEWPAYGADLSSTRYSPLDQINADNVSDLEIAPTCP